MKVASIDVWPVSIPFVEPFEVWRGTVKSKDHVIVEIHTDEGISGIGEASPFLYYAAETQDDVITTITRHIAPLILGVDPFQSEMIHSLLAQVIEGHNFSKAAIEMAMWDIKGKALGVPLYQLLGGTVSEVVPVVALLRTGPKDAMAEQARLKVQQGFTRLKVKIGFDPATDVSVVGAIREEVGNDISIRVDAEERYDLKTSVSLARRLEEYNVEFLSQPVPRRQLRQMAELRTMTGIPLTADESIESPEDVMLASESRTADLINIKVIKSGGILRAKRMAAIAETAGIGCFVGSMVEMGPGTALGAHFSLSTPAVTAASELVGPQLLVDDVLAEPLGFKNGALIVPNSPGLGVELDRYKLKKYATEAR